MVLSPTLRVFTILSANSDHILFLLILKSKNISKYINFWKPVPNQIVHQLMVHSFFWINFQNYIGLITWFVYGGLPFLASTLGFQEKIGSSSIENNLIIPYIELRTFWRNRRSIWKIIIQNLSGVVTIGTLTKAFPNVNFKDKTKLQPKKIVKFWMPQCDQLLLSEWKK